LGKEELQTLKDRAKFFGLEQEKEQEKEQTFTEFKKKYIKAVESIPVARTSSFTAAKTLEEAEEYAQRFVSKYKSKYTGNVSFKGMDVDHANTVNRVLTTVFDDYDIDMLGNVTTMNFRESKWKSAVDDGVAGAYQWGGSGGTLYVNQKLIGTAKVETAFTGKAEDLLSQVLGGVDTLLENPNLKPKQRTYLEALKKSGVQCVAQKADDFTESVIVHEAGHMLDDKVFRKAFKEAGFDLSASMDKYASGISGYAVSTSQEYVAESFASYWMGNTEILDPDLVKIFESTKGGAAKKLIEKSDSNGTIISELSAYGRSSKNYPTIYLQKQEYAHVMSEIATHITEEQKAQSVFSKAIGDYIYTVENNGFGDYRVIGKKLIFDDGLDEIW